MGIGGRPGGERLCESSPSSPSSSGSACEDVRRGSAGGPDLGVGGGGVALGAGGGGVLRDIGAGGVPRCPKARDAAATLPIEFAISGFAAFGCMR